MSSRTASGLFEPSLTVDVPDYIDLERHRELVGRSFSRPIRWVLVGLTSIVLLLGLLNVFGQRPKTLNAESAKAKLEVYAPSHLRGGLLYQARFTIFARQKLNHAVLLLSPGWAESQQMNTIEPSPVAQGSRRRRTRSASGRTRPLECARSPPRARPRARARRPP